MSDVHDTGGYRLVNAYEQKVMDMVRRLVEQDPEMCQCEKCFLDACAIVFNKGFFHFVTTEKGELLAMLYDLDDTREMELLVEALNAVKIVKAHPIH